MAEAIASTVAGKKGNYLVFFPYYKYLQAVGRVIRTETDRGVVLLIDERFGHSAYRRIFPQEWSNVHYVESTKEIKRMLKGFWDGCDKP